MNTIILKGIKKTTFWGSGFFMELLLILFVLASMRQNTGSASEIDLIYILQKKTSRVINFNNFQQSFHSHLLPLSNHHYLYNYINSS